MFKKSVISGFAAGLWVLSAWPGGGMNAKRGSQNEKYKDHPFAVGLKAA
jgi:hypothetical protein